MDVSIRPAKASDVGSLVALSDRTIRADYASFLGEEAVEQYIASGAVETCLQQSVDRCIVVLAGERLGGCCDHNGPMIELIIVDHELQSRGLGSRLLEHCEQQLFAAHAELSLESFVPNDKANRFYRRHGWTESARAPDITSGVDKITFRKTRPAPGRSPG
jgi:ribosomal protein S18 acetylase RimI-like enzyme